VSSDEVSFDPGVYLLKKDRAAALKAGPAEAIKDDVGPEVTSTDINEVGLAVDGSGLRSEVTEVHARTLVLSGSIPPEVGTRLIPKLRSGNQLSLEVTFSVEIGGPDAIYLLRELQQILADLNLTDKIKIEPR
jgi:hypothetical protein